jgi:hypothetical protein
MNNWRSLYIYYISGTGNAKASSEWIADETNKQGLNALETGRLIKTMSDLIL